MEWAIRLFFVLQSVLLQLLRPVLWYLNRQRPSLVPPPKDSILKKSAVDLAAWIRRREITSEAVVEAYICRMKEVNPLINAVVEDRFEEALRDARRCDERLRAGEVNAVTLRTLQPLYGVPFTVKESCSLKGLSHTGCTLVRQGTKAHSDGSFVAALRKAGAIPLCVTNTPELCSGFESANYLYGRTNNPYDLRCSAGGSSGGEAALLGAGASLIGVGSDLAGSIRLPALFNGVFGHKPTAGIISTNGHYPNSDSPWFRKCLVVGPMARYAEDLILAMQIVTSDSKQDLRFDQPIRIGDLKVFYVEDLGESLGSISPSKEIKGSIAKASRYLEKSGATVAEIDLGDLEDIVEICFSPIFCVDSLPQILINPDDPKHERSSPAEIVKSFLGFSLYTKSAIFMKLVKDIRGFIPVSKAPFYEKKGEQLRQKLLETLGKDGVLICPTFPTVAGYHNNTVLQSSAAIYCALFNVFGFPSTQVPMGLNENGMPLGFQVVAAPNQDRLCLAVAKELEKGFGGWIPPNDK
ncbi:fatty-acid amide hydrolase 2-A isoform X2 [Orussus abietinus]|uniref:fatty-acid amide hydrolase 2-A isoform X2 n=1 Tax=Orussus abietinus TaxID=222816 RepID=UPI0006268A03|nr:fatty-acid amide hydrolase 2-A isoform X2 [Orussus abietinus]